MQGDSSQSTGLLSENELHLKNSKPQTKNTKRTKN